MNIAAADDIVEVWEAGRIVPGPLQAKFRRAGE